MAAYSGAAKRQSSSRRITSYGAVFLALLLTGFFVYLRFSFGQLPLQQY
jgi:hypothetical protein